MVLTDEQVDAYMKMPMAFEDVIRCVFEDGFRDGKEHKMEELLGEANPKLPTPSYPYWHFSFCASAWSLFLIYFLK